MEVSGLDFLSVAGSALAQGTAPSVPWARLVLAFLFCIGVALSAIAFIRWRGGNGSLLGGWIAATRRAQSDKRDLELLERLVLSPTSQLVSVRCRDRQLVILTSNSGAQLVSELSAAAGSEITQ